QQSFSVRFDYKVFFTEDLFDEKNNTLRDFLNTQKTDITKKIFFIIDAGVSAHHPTLEKQIKNYFKTVPSCSLVEEIMIIPGGEQSKNTKEFFYKIVDAVDQHGIDRHSYIVAIGGGSVLDLAGYAAAVSHRSVRHIRIPTTVLS